MWWSLAHAPLDLASLAQAPPVPPSGVAAPQGDERGTLALNMFVYRIRKYIGAYTAALGGDVDAVVFSAGIGENSAVIRNMICQDLQVSAAAWLLPCR